MANILSKIKKEKLVGKGGASFPVHLKWEDVIKTKADRKFVICNASEGEPGVNKDDYIFEHFPEKVIEGIEITMEAVGAEKGYIFINEDYYKKYHQRLKSFINKDIELFRKPHTGGYIAGEESSLINSIEGKRIEPRKKPPYPCTNGLWAYPTVVNNVETFYDISLVNSGDYKKTRFYTISGDCTWPGVFEFGDEMTIGDILFETKNYPKFDFFVQVGGAASGEVLNSKQLDRKVGGSSSITIYSSQKNKPIDVIRNWLTFFMNESCGQCTPCREGTYRLREIINNTEPNWHMFFEILKDLPETSFCPLGASVPIPIISYFENVLVNNPEYNSIYQDNK